MNSASYHHVDFCGGSRLCSTNAELGKANGGRGWAYTSGKEKRNFHAIGLRAFFISSQASFSLAKPRTLSWANLHIPAGMYCSALSYTRGKKNKDRMGSKGILLHQWRCYRPLDEQFFVHFLEFPINEGLRGNVLQSPWQISALE